MPFPTIKCPYCSTINTLRAETQTRKVGFQLKSGLSSEETSTRQIVYDGVSCVLCNRNYMLIEMADYSWVIQKLEPSDTLLTSLKAKFPEAELESIFTHIIGITKPKGTWRRLYKQDRLHICFEYEGIRAFIDCHYKRDTLKGLNVCEV